MSEPKGEPRANGPHRLDRRQITSTRRPSRSARGTTWPQINLGGESRCLVTVDALLEGTHFDLKTATPRQVGYKASR